MRTRALAAGLGLLALAACADANPMATRSPSRPRAAISDGNFSVDAGTFEKHNNTTYWATYSGGTVDVEEQGIGDWILLGTVDAVWGDGQSFSTYSGLTVRVTAHPASGCTFLRWRMNHGSTVSTSNPLILNNYPTAEEFTGEFQCVV